MATKNNNPIEWHGVKDSLSTQISQSAEYLGSLSKSFSNAQAKIDLQTASTPLANAAASLTQDPAQNGNSKSQ